MTRGRSAFRSLCFLLRPLGIRILASSRPSRSRETQRGQRKGLFGKVSCVQHALSRPAGVTTLGATGPSLPCGEEGALRAKPWLVLGLIAGEERWHPSQMTALWEPAWVGGGPRVPTAPVGSELPWEAGRSCLLLDRDLPTGQGQACPPHVPGDHAGPWWMALGVCRNRVQFHLCRSGDQERWGV